MTEMNYQRNTANAFKMRLQEFFENYMFVVFQ